MAMGFSYEHRKAVMYAINAGIDKGTVKINSFTMGPDDDPAAFPSTAPPASAFRGGFFGGSFVGLWPWGDAVEPKTSAENPHRVGTDEWKAWEHEHVINRQRFGHGTNALTEAKREADERIANVNLDALASPTSVDDLLEEMDRLDDEMRCEDAQRRLQAQMEQMWATALGPAFDRLHAAAYQAQNQFTFFTEKFDGLIIGRCGFTKRYAKPEPVKPPVFLAEQSKQRWNNRGLAHKNPKRGRR